MSAPMKVLTLHQPWASLIALGVKTIETRSWSTAYRGPLAIHAGSTWPKMMTLPPLVHSGPWEERDAHNGQTWHVCNTIRDPQFQGPLPCNPRTGRQRRVPKAAQAPTLFWPHAGPWERRTEGKPEFVHSEPLPLGAIVATCDLVDVVRMVSWSPLDGPATWAAHMIPAPQFKDDTERFLLLRDHVTGSDALRSDGPLPAEIDATPQLPFGDFAPGRFAWLLDNITPLDVPVPFKGGQGLTKSWVA